MIRKSSAITLDVLMHTIQNELNEGELILLV